MKTRHFVSIAAFVAGVAVAIAAGVYAQSGYPTRPRFNSVGIGVTAPSSNGKQVISDNNPIAWVREADQGATSQYWAAPTVNGNVMQFMACTAFGSGCASFLNATRSAGTITNLDLFGTALTLNGVASSDFGRLSQNQTWAGSQTIQGNVAIASAASPSLSTQTSATAASNYASNLTMVDSAGTPTTTYQFTANNGATAGFGCGSNECGGIWSQAAQTVITANSNNDVLSITSNALAFDGINLTPTNGSMSSSTGTGWASMPTLQAQLKRIGDVVFWEITDGFVTGTSNATTISFTGAVPVGFRPSSDRAGGRVLATNNGTIENYGAACMWVEADGDVSFNRASGVCGAGGTGWTASGTKAIRGSAGFYFVN